MFLNNFIQMLARRFQNKRVHKWQILCTLFIIIGGKLDAVTQMSSVGPPGLTQGDVEVTSRVIDGAHQNEI